MINYNYNLPEPQKSVLGLIFIIGAMILTMIIESL